MASGSMSKVGKKLIKGLEQALDYEAGASSKARSEYRKLRSGICHFCDYHCRKGHKCGLYKRFAKRFPHKA